MAEIAIAGATAVLRQVVITFGELVVHKGSRLDELTEEMKWIENEMRYIRAYLEDADAADDVEGGSSEEATSLKDNITVLAHDVEGGSSVEATSLKDTITVLAHDVKDVVETYFPQIASEKGKGRLGWLKTAKTVHDDFVVELKGIRRMVEKIIPFIIRTTLKTKVDTWNPRPTLPDIDEVGLDEHREKLASEKGKGCLGWLKTAKTAHDDFVVELKGIRRRVEEIIPFIIRTTQKTKVDTWDPRRTLPDIDEVSLDEHREKLVAEVLNRDPEHRVVSIIGPSSSRNTSLAKKIYDSVKQDFECSAWIDASNQPNIEELLLDIARQVGLEEEKWEQNIEANVNTFLRHKRYVIAINDLCQKEPWNVLKTSIPENFSSGSRIIVTSPCTDVSVNVGGQSSLYELNANMLFFEMVLKNMKETSNCLPPQLEVIGKKIMENCGDVPLVELTNMLFQRERTENAWNEVLKSLSGQNPRSKILALSYKDLPTKLKPCFLYFGLFPKEHKILAFDLFNLWAAEGFIRQGGGVQEVEEVGEEYLNHLISKNLIQVDRRRFDGRIGSCYISDILHSHCVTVAKAIGFFNICNDTASTSSAMTPRRVTTHDLSLPSSYSSPKLLVHIAEEVNEGNKEHFVNFLKQSKFVRVLRLVLESLQISLPNEIGDLSHLSYIGLKVTSGRVKLPATISNLGSLQTLDARECEDGVTIPDSILRMKQLRHLLLHRESEVKFDEGGPLLLNMGKFFFHHPIEEASPNLQTLYMLRVGRCWPACYKFPKFTSLRKLGVSFKKGEWSKVKVFLDATTVPHKLEILRLEDMGADRGKDMGADRGTLYNMVELNLCRYENLCRLHLGVPMVKFPEHDKLPPNLTKLTLVNTYLKKDPMETLKKLSKLKILKLKYGSYMGEKMTVCSRGGLHDNFRQLEVLEIGELPWLKEFIVDDDNVMPQLKKLRIKGCLENLVVTRIPNRIRDKMITV